MREKRFFIMGCNIVAAICFGIVSYGHFYREQIALGWLFAILTIAQLYLAFRHAADIKKNQ